MRQIILKEVDFQSGFSVLNFNGNDLFPNTFLGAKFLWIRVWREILFSFSTTCSPMAYHSLLLFIHRSKIWFAISPWRVECRRYVKSIFVDLTKSLYFVVSEQLLWMIINSIHLGIHVIKHFWTKIVFRRLLTHP